MFFCALQRTAVGGRGVHMRRVLTALMLFILLASLPGSQGTSRPFNASQALTTRAVADVRLGLRFGALTLVEAWDLISPHSDFGGLSGMALVGTRNFLMVSDSGYRLRFKLAADGTARPGGFEKLPPPLPGYTGKFQYDGEALTHDPATGRYWTAMEGMGQIWCFEANDVRRTRTKQPILASWPDNGGAEVLTRLPDGRFIVLSERAGPSGQPEGVMFSGDPAERSTTSFRFFHDAGRQGAATDAAVLPDGRLVIIYRKLGLWPIFTTSIAIADPSKLKSGAMLTSTTIAVVKDRRLAENYEGVAVQQDKDGLSLWLVSDDNLQDWQHSRLVRFHIDPAALRPSGLRPAKRAAPEPARP